MTEAEFIAGIDCAFPYHDPPRARRLIEQACGISPNAAFMVMHELARVPASVTVSADRRRDLLNHLLSHLHHPLAAQVSRFAEELIAGRDVPVAEAITGMRAVAEFRGQYAALSIISFTCADPTGAVDQIYEEIVQSWKPV